MRDSALFGPAGSSEQFKQKYKKTIDMPKFLQECGLSAFEYQCGRGVKISESSAHAFGEEAEQYGIALSIHAPYYISLASEDEKKRENSIQYILQSAIAANAMGAERIVVHSGSRGKRSREEAIEIASQTLKVAQDVLDDQGLAHIHICPETMGKINQLGDLNEVMKLCSVDERFYPCIDFGHLNARTAGQMNSVEAYKTILNTIENCLGIDRLRVFHAHFSKIEYTENGGEKRHLTFADHQYGPEFEPLMVLIARKQLTPTIICESAGTQTEDAIAMQTVYQVEKENAYYN